MALGYTVIAVIATVGIAVAITIGIAITTMAFVKAFVEVTTFIINVDFSHLQHILLVLRNSYAIRSNRERNSWHRRLPSAFGLDSYFINFDF